MNVWSWLQRMEIGACRQLLVRRENVTHLGLSKRILFASDLHLKKDGPRQVVAGILDIVSSERPDVVLLGGDLVDWSSGLEPLHRLVANMSALAPVAAVGGNHDRWIGLAQVREAVLEGGGHWLEDKPLRWAPNAVAYGNPQQELWSAHCQVLCIHHPGPPLPETMWPRLFELYGTVEVRRSRFTVSAAGLVYARMVIEKHGGTLGFEHHVEEGTDLVVRFPR